ncbi:Hypothetical protein Minf_2158 [Methylacidiphilum infernorum V4]|uniref:Uncharacterized protein n=1 Tax=Methylacidiphilum infernorum (isolate V4) TaxID=481448 RepID=B3DZM7_METI4|nr:Hypothetical protein Minf_2158 [Methylacidiphilum infernorum V4]
MFYPPSKVQARVPARPLSLLDRTLLGRIPLGKLVPSFFKKLSFLGFPQCVKRGT